MTDIVAHGSLYGDDFLESHDPIPPPPPVDTGECNCGITDDYDRTVSLTSHSGGTDNLGTYLGTASCGLDWDVLLRNSVSVSVDGTRASMAFGDIVSHNGLVSASLPVPSGLNYDATVTHSVTFMLSNFGGPSFDAESLRLSFQVGGNLAPVATIWIYPSNTSLWLQGIGATPGASAYSQITWTADVISGTQIPLAFWAAGITYTFSTYVSGTTTVATVSDGTTTYSTAFGSVQHVITQLNLIIERKLVAPFTSSVVQTVYLDNLIVPEVTVCSLYVNFDDFNRTVTGGWGTAGPDPDAHSYFTFSTTPPTIAVTPKVGSVAGYGYISFPSLFTQRTMELSAPGPWNTPTGFTMRFWFWGDRAGIDVDIADSDGELDLMVEIKTPNGFIDLETQQFDNFDFISPFPISLSTWYACELEYTPGSQARVKVWQLGQTKPTSWSATTSPCDPITGDLWIGLYAPTSGSTPEQVRIAHLEFEYEGMPCPAGVDTILIDPPLEAHHGLPYGPVAVIEPADGVTTTFTLPVYPGGGYVTGTLQVFVDGMDQVIAETDTALGTFSLSWAPATADIITARWVVP